MNLKYFFRMLGLVRTPKYSIRFGAQNPFTGTAYLVYFEDGRRGMFRENRNGTFNMLPAGVGKPSKVFVTPEDVVECIYSELLRQNKMNSHELN